MALFFDSTPIDTDWDDIHTLFEDMAEFAKAHPGHKFICADDPGMHHTPPRAPRLGWCAFLPHPCTYDGCEGKGWHRVNGVDRETCEGCHGSGAAPPADEQIKCWTIMLGKVTSGHGDHQEKFMEAFSALVKTAEGRQKMLDTVIGRPASP